MAIFDDKTMEAAEKMGGGWVKAKEFEGAGLTLKIESTERIKSQYGAKAEDGIVERGILEEGESFRFTFEDEEGNERKHDSSSFPMFIGMQQAELNFGDWLHIRKEGERDKTRYYVEVVEAPVTAEDMYGRGKEILMPDEVGF